MAVRRVPTETDYAYLAGILDGEGTITISRQTDRRKGRVYHCYSPHITISNTVRLMLDSIKNRFGGKIVEVNRRVEGHQKPGYILYFRKGEMLALLPKVIPYLTIKKRKAELLLEYMLSRPKKTPRGADGRFVRVRLTIRQRRIIAEIRRNNRRGTLH